MDTNINLKCESCKWGHLAKDKVGCTYCYLHKDTKTMQWTCKSYIYKPNTTLDNLKNDKEKLDLRLGQVGKELMENPGDPLIRIQYNLLESYLSIVDLRIKDYGSTKNI